MICSCKLLFTAHTKHFFVLHGCAKWLEMYWNIQQLRKHIKISGLNMSAKHILD